MQPEAFPRLIHLKSIGNSSLGYITIAENGDDLPFVIKRVYWTYYTPQNVERGFHAHKHLKQIIFAVAGTITIEIETLNSGKETFVLNEPNKGLYLPPFVWRKMQFTHSAVLLCLASDIFREEDYIREYDTFKEFRVY